jgi:hypothetical protein
VPAGLEDDPWARGIAMLRSRLEETLAGLGLEPVGTVGETFDPALHEAVFHEPDPDGVDQRVAQVIRPGYRVGERLLRPAEVVVRGPLGNRAGEPEPDPSNASDGVRRPNRSRRDVRPTTNELEAETMAKVIGIDLGTTNSAIGDPRSRPADGPRERGGQPHHPSVVAIDPKTGERWSAPSPAAGGHQPGEHGLLDQALHGPQVRRPGRAGGDQARPVQGDKAANGDVRVVMGGKEYSPPEISAMILQKLREDAEAKLGDTVNRP